MARGVAATVRCTRGGGGERRRRWPAVAGNRWRWALNDRRTPTATTRAGTETDTWRVPLSRAERACQPRRCAAPNSCTYRVRPPARRCRHRRCPFGSTPLLPPAVHPPLIPPPHPRGSAWGPPEVDLQPPSSPPCPSSGWGVGGGRLGQTADSRGTAGTLRASAATGSEQADGTWDSQRGGGRGWGWGEGRPRTHPDAATAQGERGDPACRHRRCHHTPPAARRRRLPPQPFPAAATAGRCSSLPTPPHGKQKRRRAGWRGQPQRRPRRCRPAARQTGGAALSAAPRGHAGSR